MKRARRAVAASTVLSIIAALFLAGTALAQDASPTDEKISFVQGTTANLPTVNPFKGLTSTTYYVFSLQYDLPINFAKDDLGAAPGLVTDWTQSEDGLTWTLKTREGVTWHDGEPFSAEDVVFTFNTILSNETGAFIDYFPNVESITATDANTIVWQASKPTIAPLLPPWVYIIPQHIWEPLGSYDEMKQFENFAPEEPTVGTGPFQLTEWVRGEHWTMTANPNYWAGAPNIDEIIIRKYNNVEAMVNALKQGEVDYIGGVTTDLFESLKGEPGISTHVGPATGFVQMSFNQCDPATTLANYCTKNPGTGHPALRDPVLRQAIAKAINRQELVDRILQGYGQPGTTIVPPFAAQWHIDPTTGTQDYNVDEAKALLEGAGYVDSDGDGVREAPNGDPLEFRFFLRSESEDEQKAGEFIQSWLRDIGIKTKIQVGSTDDLTGIWYDHDFDMYIWGWGPDPDPDFILSTFTSGQCGVWSDTCYTNAEYDALYDAQQVATSVDDRKAIIAEMQNMIYDDVPEVVLWYDNSLEAIRSDRWTGWINSPQPQGFWFGQYTPYSELTVRPRTAGGTARPGGDTGLPAGVWLGVIGGLVAVIVVIALVRRGRSEEDLA